MSEKIWTCKIGGEAGELPPGSDLPMRVAVREAYYRLTGRWPDFLFSGWGAELTDVEREVADGKRRLETEAFDP